MQLGSSDKSCPYTQPTLLNKYGCQSYPTQDSNCSFTSQGHTNSRSQPKAKKEMLKTSIKPEILGQFGNSSLLFSYIQCGVYVKSIKDLFQTERCSFVASKDCFSPHINDMQAQCLLTVPLAHLTCSPNLNNDAGGGQHAECGYCGQWIKVAIGFQVFTDALFKAKQL